MAPGMAPGMYPQQQSGMTPDMYPQEQSGKTPGAAPGTCILSSKGQGIIKEFECKTSVFV